MNTFFPGFITGFRECLEAFIVIAMIISFLKKTKNEKLSSSIYFGTGAGIIFSSLVALALMILSAYIGESDVYEKLWAGISSLIAVILVSGFVFWMIKNDMNMKNFVEEKTTKFLSKTGLFIVAAIMVAREGVEIALFTFAGQYSIYSILLGIAASILLGILISTSLLKVNLKTLFNITLAYLILQAGFLLGTAAHEILEATGTSVAKLFDLSGTFLDSENSIAGNFLSIFGWNSDPEWIRFLLQYGYIASLFIYWKKLTSRVKPTAH